MSSSQRDPDRATPLDEPVPARTTTGRTVALFLLLAALTVAVAASLVLAADVYLLTFLAVLVGVLFANLAKWLGRHSKLSYGVHLATVVTAFVLISITALLFFGLQVENQVQRTSRALDESLVKLEEWLQEHPPVRSAVERVPIIGDIVGDPTQPPGDKDGPDREGADREADDQRASRQSRGGSASQREASDNDNASDSSRATGEERRADEASDGPESSGGSNESDKSDKSDKSGQQGESQQDRLAENGSAEDGPPLGDLSTGWSGVGSLGSVPGRVFGAMGQLFSTTFGAVMNVAYVLFVGVFLAIKPRFYRDHFALLFPSRRRPRVKKILDDIGDTLWHWLIGRGASMVITGAGTGLALWLLNVPLPFTLGTITGLLTFIPNIGAVMALMLSMLVAFSQGPSTVMWVVVAYCGMQFVESNIITPLIQERQTAVPPPLLLMAQLMMGVLVGFLGVLVATPLLAATMVLVQRAYLEDILGEPPKEMGQGGDNDDKRDQDDQQGSSHAESPGSENGQGSGSGDDGTPSDRGAEEHAHSRS